MKHVSIALMCACAVASAQNIYTIAGIPYSHRESVDSKPALAAPLGNVHGLLIDKTSGRLVFTDESLVLRLEPDQTLLAVAGTGLAPRLNPADGTLASVLPIFIGLEMAQDNAGAVYFSDAAAGRVYRIGLDGIVTTVAGGSTLDPFASDGGPATTARLASPRGLAFDSQGNLYIAEIFCACIRRVSPLGIISTFFTISPPPNGGNAFNNIEGLTIDSQDNVYFAEYRGHVVVKVSPDGSAVTIAGTGVAGFSGDGGPANAAQLNRPSGVTVDAYGNIYITDTNNHRIRKITPDGNISTFAGTGVQGFSGDGGSAAEARLNMPAETVFDDSGNIYITDFGNRRVRMIACALPVSSCGQVPSGTITTVAGNGQTDTAFFFQGSAGDGGPAIHATFDRPSGLAFDSAGNLYVSDGLGYRVRKIAADGAVSTFAGTGRRGYSGDEGPAIEAMLDAVGPISLGPDGSLYVITGDSRVRKITSDGIIHLVAGTGTGTGINRAQGDGGPAINATLNEPGGVAFDKNGNIYIADTSNARVRKIDPNGIITTVAGPGQLGVDYFNSVAVDSQGNLLLAWTHFAPPMIQGSLNRVNADGSLTRIAGNGQACMGGPYGQPFPMDGVPAIQATLCGVTGMTIHPNGEIYFPYGPYILKISTDGIIHIVAGDAAAVALGDGGPALRASFTAGAGGPGVPAFDAAGNIYVPETGDNRIREITATALKLQVSADRIDFGADSLPVSQTIAVSTNFAEPFPYQVSVRTDDGANWLITNRATGVTGEPLTVSALPSAVAAGTYHGTVSVILAAPTPQQIDVPVTLIVASPPR